MGRLLAFILGGVAVALYGPHLFMNKAQLDQYQTWWIETAFGGGDSGKAWYDSIFQFGPGIFAGIALLLLAIRGKD